jgi:hypothetical protein
MERGWTVKTARNRIIDRLNVSTVEDAIDRRIIQYDKDGSMFVVVRYGSAILQEIKFRKQYNESAAVQKLPSIQRSIASGALDEEIKRVRYFRYGYDF